MFIKKLIKSLFIFIIVCFIIFEGIYYWGTFKLPDDRNPTSKIYSEAILQISWLVLGGEKSCDMVSLCLFNIFIKKNGSIAISSARVILSRTNPYWSSSFEWQYAFMTATVWVSRNWTADEAISTILSVADFGNGFYGIEKAAKGYYNIKIKDLTIEEISVLVTLLRGSEFYDPWLHRDRLKEQAIKLLERDSQFSSRLSTDLDKGFFGRLVKPPVKIQDCP
jgi:hypothetical protein